MAAKMNLKIRKFPRRGWLAQQGYISKGAPWGGWMSRELRGLSPVHLSPETQGQASLNTSGDLAALRDARRPSQTPEIEGPFWSLSTTSQVHRDVAGCPRSLPIHLWFQPESERARAMLLLGSSASKRPNPFSPPKAPSVSTRGFKGTSTYEP